MGHCRRQDSLEDQPVAGKAMGLPGGCGSPIERVTVVRPRARSEPCDLPAWRPSRANPPASTRAAARTPSVRRSSHTLGSLGGLVPALPPAGPLHRRQGCRRGVQGRRQQAIVAAVGRGQDGCQRDAGCLAGNRALEALLAAVDRARPGDLAATGRLGDTAVDGQVLGSNLGSVSPGTAMPSGRAGQPAGLPSPSRLAVMRCSTSTVARYSSRVTPSTSRRRVTSTCSASLARVAVPAAVSA
jgi:hypothetical protein